LVKVKGIREIPKYTMKQKTVYDFETKNPIIQIVDIDYFIKEKVLNINLTRKLEKDKGDNVLSLNEYKYSNTFENLLLENCLDNGKFKFILEDPTILTDYLKEYLNITFHKDNATIKINISVGKRYHAINILCLQVDLANVIENLEKEIGNLEEENSNLKEKNNNLLELNSYFKKENENLNSENTNLIEKIAKCGEYADAILFNQKSYTEQEKFKISNEKLLNSTFQYPQPGNTPRVTNETKNKFIKEMQNNEILIIEKVIGSYHRRGHQNSLDQDCIYVWITNFGKLFYYHSKCGGLENYKCFDFWIPNEFIVILQNITTTCTTLFNENDHFSGSYMFYNNICKILSTMKEILSVRKLNYDPTLFVEKNKNN
jgi:FtsZ-binding cell division protein ZapB